MQKESKTDDENDLNDSGDAEIYINLDSVINELLNKDFVFAEDNIDLTINKLDNIDIKLDSMDSDFFEDIDIELDSLDFILNNSDLEIKKLEDGLDVKNLMLEIKKNVLDSLECNMKKIKIVISENMKTLKDSLKVKMHKLKSDIHKEINLKNLKFRDYRNMTDEEIIESLKENGIIEYEKEVDIKRDNDKVIIKITKTKEQ